VALANDRFLAGIPILAHALLEVTGILIASVGDPPTHFRCGCWVCGFVLEQPLPETNPEEIEQALQAALRQEVVRVGCLHYARYEEVTDSPHYALSAEIRAAITSIYRERTRRR